MVDDKDRSEALEGPTCFDSAYYENEIRKDVLHQHKITAFKYPLNSTSFIIPTAAHLPERRFNLQETENKDKALLFRLFVAAFNYAFTDEFAPLYSKNLISSTSKPFIDWLNDVEIANRYSLLKDFESYMFDKRQNYGGYSELTPLKNVMFLAYQNEAFITSLTTEEASYLAELKKTKISPNLNRKQISLASYFGKLDWLRSEEPGIGNQLYQTLASAKLTIASLKFTASVIIIEIYKAKSAFRQFLIENELTSNYVDESGFDDFSPSRKKGAIGLYVYNLLCKFHDLKEKSPYLRNALELVLLSKVTSWSNFEKVCAALDSKQNMMSIFCTKISHRKVFSGWFADMTFTHNPFGDLFSPQILLQLANDKALMPISKIEAWMFNWLMASLTVQPSDISKLSRHSFRLMKVGGRVTYIECEYFKGRANAIHSTRSLSVRKPEGKALLAILNQNFENTRCESAGSRPTITPTLSGRCGLLNAVLKLSFISVELKTTHEQQGNTPLIMPLALNALISNGKHTGNIVPNPKDYTIEEKQALVSLSKAESPISIFGLQAIKNSAVHANSDPYTLHYLLNFNSHTNQTEKINYLTADNEEFLNSAGRITRSIMFDLIDNVFDLNFTDLSEKRMNIAKASFNNEFGNVMNSISYKSEEMLSRLKIVTGQDRGVISEVGILSLSDKQLDEFAPIYVLDSKVTAFKIFNYLHEFEKNYKKLLNRYPDHLYQTVFPNVEWMERVLPKLSKSSVMGGEELFQKMLLAGVSISVFHSI